MEHDKQVAYQSETLPGNIALDGWTASLEGGRVTVRGPCPVCHGEAYGPPVPSPEDDRGLTAEAELPEATVGVLAIGRGPMLTYDIHATCACGSPHGDDEAKNCGRDWYVPVSAEDAG